MFYNINNKTALNYHYRKGIRIKNLNFCIHSKPFQIPFVMFGIIYTQINFEHY